MARNLMFFILAILLPVQVQGQQPQIEQERQQRSDPIRQQNLIGPRDLQVRDGQEMAPSSPGDSDIGVQRVMKRKKEVLNFSLFGDVSIYHTDNVALVRPRPVPENFMVGQTGFSVTPEILPGLFAEATIRQQWFRYDELIAFDFDSMNVGGGLSYLVPQLPGLVVFGRYNYNRLTYVHANPDGAEGTEFFLNNTATFGLQKIFPISKAHYVAVGHTSVLGWSDPVLPQRDEYSVFTSYNLKITRMLDSSVGYRASYITYNFGDREDLNHSFSGGLTFHPNKYFSVAANTSFGMNDSNMPQFKYEVLNFGGGLSAKLRF